MFGWLGFKEKTPSVETQQALEEHFLHPEEILTYFTTLTGIHFRNKEEMATSKIIYYCRSKGIHSFIELQERMQNDFLLREGLINLLTVNETFFFREMAQIEFLKNKVYEEHSNIRILCAPGSSGEEPYSIAIALLERGISPHRIHIVSIDINSDVTESAKVGQYTLRSLHKTPQEIQEKYFVITDAGYRIGDEVKRLVEFKTLNIFDDALFALGKFDVVFSRNMLIYFDEPTVIRAVERLGRLAQSQSALFFFGHADFVKTPPSLMEHYENGIKFYTTR